MITCGYTEIFNMNLVCISYFKQHDNYSNQETALVDFEASNFS